MVRRPQRAGTRLVALGDLLLDVVVTPHEPIVAGTDVPGELRFRRGGSAANTAAAFARAGGSASLITSLGSDGWGRRLATSLRGDGVRVHAIRQRGPSGRLAAFIDHRGERSFVTERGVADELRPKDIDPRWLRSAAALHVPAYSLFAEPIGSAAVAAASMAHDVDAIVSVDLSSQGPLLAFGVRKAGARIGELRPTILFANRDEAAAMLRRGGRRAWPGLLDLAPIVVVKDGVAGCRVLWREGDPAGVLQLDVAAKRLGRVDTTGAGDAFAAGFLHSLIRPGGSLDPGRPGDAGRRLGAFGAPALRRAALSGHRSAARALRHQRPLLELV